VVASLDIVDREILDLKGAKNCREDGCGGEGGGVLYGGGDRADSSRVLEASGREGLVQLCEG